MFWKCVGKSQRFLDLSPKLKLVLWHSSASSEKSEHFGSNSYSWHLVKRHNFFGSNLCDRWGPLHKVLVYTDLRGLKVNTIPVSSLTYFCVSLTWNAASHFRACWYITLPNKAALAPVQVRHRLLAHFQADETGYPRRMHGQKNVISTRTCQQKERRVYDVMWDWTA